MSHLMIDIETLATDENATILTIGAQGFELDSDSYTDVTFYERITLESQEGRSIDDNTVEWWGNQSADAQEEAFGETGRIDIKPALEQLSKIAWKHKKIWANGTLFDIIILENAMKQYGVAIPWKYWNICDTRTVYGLVPGVGKLGNNHNALADCCNQIDLLQKSVKMMGLVD